jgi:N-acetylneuraminate synthase/N,N'-diacetyllegionaminate synthase
MCTLDEVAEAIAWIDTASPGGRAELTILHCTSSYPAEPQDVNLRAMLTMAEAFGRPVGYSDHTRGIEISVAAVALGATVIEKHFTVSRALPGPDHAASLESAELAELVRSIRCVETALGDGTKAPQPVEIATRALVRRSIAAARTLPAGTVLTRADLTTMRPGTGIPPVTLEALVGRRLGRTVDAGQLLQWDTLE